GGRPGRAEFRLALQVSVSLALAIIASQMIAGPKPYWIPLTALIVSCASFGESLLKSLERALGTILGLLVGQLAWILLRDRPDSMIGVIAAAVFGMFFCRIGPYRWILFWLTLALSGLLHLADVGAAFYLARLRDTGTGAVIALVVCRVLLPMRTADAAQARRREYLDAIAGQLRNFAAALRGPSAAAPAALFNDTAARALAALHALADAEMVEAAVDRAVRLAVRRRLAAADRIARCLVSLQSILPMLRAAADPVAAGFVADVAEAASGRGPPTDAEAIGSRTQAMLATRAGASAQVEQLAAELRLFRLLSAISEAAMVLREDLNRRR
ncbi:MAG TPA: FUSC family protein, partial [Acetobacteraceae bacterium]|nr:FUSC family protein [Acetobacteraceae bacterium]